MLLSLIQHDMRDSGNRNSFRAGDSDGGTWADHVNDSRSRSASSDGSIAVKRLGFSEAMLRYMTDPKIRYECRNDA